MTEKAAPPRLKWRKKPVVIEAVQWGGANETGWPEGWWPYTSLFRLKEDERGAYLLIPTLEGDMQARDGDWIIRGVKGEFYPCRTDIFEMTYEAIPDAPKEPSK